MEFNPMWSYNIRNQKGRKRGSGHATIQILAKCLEEDGFFFTTYCFSLDIIKNHKQKYPPAFDNIVTCR